jgi:hypothetical protein
MRYNWRWDELGLALLDHRKSVVGNIIILLQETFPRFKDYRRTGVTCFVASLESVLGASDARLKFVGWEGLTADVLQDAGFNMEEVVPHNGMPLAVAAIVHELHGMFGSRAECGNWGDRITSCSVEDWRQASAYPDLALERPQRRPCLRAAAIADLQALHAFDG